MAEQRITEHDRQVRNQKALELHLAGCSYRTIAEQLQISLAVAHDAVKSALAARQSADVGGVGASGSSGSQAQVIQAELARLDAMLMGLWPKARTGRESAVAQVLKIGEQRIKFITMLEAIGGRPGTPPVEGDAAPPVDQLAQIRKRRDDKRAGL